MRLDGITSHKTLSYTILNLFLLQLRKSKRRRRRRGKKANAKKQQQNIISKKLKLESEKERKPNRMEQRKQPNQENRGAHILQAYSKYHIEFQTNAGMEEKKRL